MKTSSITAPDMPLARTILSVLALLTSSVLAQEKLETQKTEFLCPMHPDVRQTKQTPCLVCGMDMVKASRPPTKVHVPLIGLRDYCEDYVRKSLHGPVPAGVSTFEIVAAHVALKGNAWQRDLHSLLRRPEQGWVIAAAFQLGKLKDRQAIPALQMLMANGTSHLAHKFYCPQHPKVKADEAGKCSDCGTQLSPTNHLILNQQYAAGALHEMGDEEALRTLERAARTRNGTFTLPLLALRDTASVRTTLAEATADSKSPQHRAAAVLAQVQLGIEESLAPAIQLLEDNDPKVRCRTIWALGVSGLDKAKKPLLQIAHGLDQLLSDRIIAATALVKLGHQEQVSFLMDSFHKASEHEDRYQVCYSLGEVGDARALPLLQTAIETGELRDIAVTAAAKILGREASASTNK